MKQSQKIKARESGQTREGIGAMAVRLLRCHAFTDAPNTSVVLCSRGGRSGWWMEGRRWRRKVEKEGERGAEEEAMVERVVHTAGRWIEQKRKRKIRTEMELMKEKMKRYLANEMTSLILIV